MDAGRPTGTSGRSPFLFPEPTHTNQGLHQAALTDKGLKSGANGVGWEALHTRPDLWFPQAMEGRGLCPFDLVPSEFV